MRHSAILTFTVVLLLAVGAFAQDQAKEKNPVQRELDALLAEYENTELGPVEAYHAFLPRFEKFAKDYKDTEPEVRATLWLVQQTWWLREEGKMESTAMPMAEDLIKRHPDSPQLGMLAEYYYVFTKPQRETLYHRLIEISDQPEVEAAAHFGLAKTLPARQADGSPNEHFAALAGEFAKVKWRETTYGAIADAYLHPLTRADLAVGQPAPEIEGIDHNGKPMKLSDYRGKVVLLDFWGDW